MKVINVFCVTCQDFSYKLLHLKLPVLINSVTKYAEMDLFTMISVMMQIQTQETGVAVTAQ